MVEKGNKEINLLLNDAIATDLNTTNLLSPHLRLHYQVETVLEKKLQKKKSKLKTTT